MLRVDLFSYFGIFLVCCGLYGPIPWWPQTMMASRYTMTATTMKMWKTNIGILLRNRQIYDIVGQISPSYVFVRRGLCPLWTSWSLWSSLLNPVCCLRSEDHGDGVRSKVDALSVNRLTLLGRIHMARVVVESLSLDGTSAVDVVPVRDRQRGRGARGKPPTPTRTLDKNRRYLVCILSHTYAHVFVWIVGPPRSVNQDSTMMATNHDGPKNDHDGHNLDGRKPGWNLSDDV